MLGEVLQVGEAMPLKDLRIFMTRNQRIGRQRMMGQSESAFNVLGEYEKGSTSSSLKIDALITQFCPCVRFPLESW